MDKKMRKQIGRPLKHDVKRKYAKKMQLYAIICKISSYEIYMLQKFALPGPTLLRMQNMQKICKKYAQNMHYMQFMQTMAPICNICTGDFKLSDATVTVAVPGFQ